MRLRTSPKSLLNDGLTAHERVGAPVDVGEQVVEDLADRVGEHERARP